jgi:hypothetical protein
MIVYILLRLLGIVNLIRIAEGEKENILERKLHKLVRRMGCT